MPRQMALKSFRDLQWANRYAPHIAPVNEYVDEMRGRGRGWSPNVALLPGSRRSAADDRDKAPLTPSTLWAVQRGASGSGSRLCVVDARRGGISQVRASVATTPRSHDDCPTVICSAMVPITIGGRPKCRAANIRGLGRGLCRACRIQSDPPVAPNSQCLGVIGDRCGYEGEQ